jgi:RNA polymerase sigma-70 factor, ECF subfamily
VNEIECARIFALLSEYLDQELPAATCDEMEQHLSGCPQCVEFVRSLRRSIELCRQYGGCRSEAQLDPNVMDSLRKAYAEMLLKRRTSADDASRTRNSDGN